MSLKVSGLPFGWAGVEQHGAERRQDLRGGRGGELPGRLDESDSISSAQRQNQTQRRRAAAVTLTMWRRCCCSRQETCGVQLLDAAIGHGEDRLDLLATLGREHGRQQVASVGGSCEDTWRHRDLLIHTRTTTLIENKYLNSHQWSTD